MHTQTPQLAFRVALHQTSRLFLLGENHLEDFAVLRSSEHFVAAPAHTANAEACNAFNKTVNTRNAFCVCSGLHLVHSPL